MEGFRHSMDFGACFLEPRSYQWHLKDLVAPKGMSASQYWDQEL
jgi:hypothetical protein